MAKESRRCKLSIYNQSVENVISFKYLGTNITSARNLKEKAKTRKKASLILGYLRDMIWRNRYMSTRSKVRIHKKNIKAVMAYAIETETGNSTTKRLLRTTEMRTLRAIAGYILFDYKRNDEVREICEVQNIVRWGRSKRREWRMM